MRVETEGSFLQGVPTDVRGGGVWGQAGGLPVGSEGKREGDEEGGGWGGDRQRNRQVHAYTFAKTTL